MKNDPKKSEQEWESICHRCGRCCYEKIDFEGGIYYTKLPCEFLDLSTNLCRVYSKRDVKRPGCVRLTNDVLKKGVLPVDCPYVADIENYLAPGLAEDGDPDDS